MRRSGLQLKHALASVSVIADLREVLRATIKSAPDVATKLGSLVVEIDQLLIQTPKAFVPREWEVVLAGLRVLISQITCSLIAHGAEGDLVAERQRCDWLSNELRKHVSTGLLALPDSQELVRQAIVGGDMLDSEELGQFLSSISLPTVYWQVQEEGNPYPSDDEKDDNAPNPLVRVIVFLDNAPIASPQLLKSGLLYPLAFRVRGLIWPDGAEKLRLDLHTTCPPSEFAVSTFMLPRPGSTDALEYEGELQGQIKFHSGQSSLLDDIVFAVRGAFEMKNGEIQEVPVIGHDELRIRVVSEDRHPLMTGNRRLDRHIEELVTRLLEECPRVRGELAELLPMLEALASLLSTYAQDAIYKGQSKVLESEFQKTVLRDLRLRLGSDVQGHTNQAGGVTDIRYHGVVVELKVEDQNGDRDHICRKYASQPVQYAGIEARQVSVLLVLDLTEKVSPPGDIRNDILLRAVQTHGGNDTAKEFPAKAIVFVINGNMKNPSEYSR